MPRRERPVAMENKCVAEVAQGLRTLRHQRGLTLQQLSREAHYSVSALSDATSGKKLPTRELTAAFVTACGGDVNAWMDRWDAAADMLSTGRTEFAPPIPIPYEASSAEDATSVPDEIEPNDTATDDTDQTAVRRSWRSWPLKGVTIAGCWMVILVGTGGLLTGMTRPGSAPTPGASPEWPIHMVVTDHNGVQVRLYRSLLEEGEGAHVLPYGTSVDVLCSTKDPRDGQSAEYMLAAPMIGLYASASGFSASAKAVNLPRCATEYMIDVLPTR